ncbi:MAG TPA: bifunctional precorrin-2 dehydrogenase/sirohydrochlorin ferrochelatase [Chitinophagaceae bacterium]|jgi:siroheme synthase-like protein|nr:bifunctional precorrin-2 dehydrogenase/sirohydrochlorin ferrochelatase [Chitinophagaceae bacterium]
MFPTEEKNTLFPVFVKIDHLHTLVVGGGTVGLEKLNALLNNAADAQVMLVARHILPEIKTVAEHASNVRLAERDFSSCDLYGMDLAIIATNDAVENKRIRDTAKSMRVLVNVADTPDLCDFYLGSIVQKGNIKIAISTNGKSPTVAKRIREVLTEMIPDEMDAVLSNLSEIRMKLKGNFSEKVKQLNKITSILVDKK